MNLTLLAKRAEKFTIDNSPLILTAIGVAGTVTTAYLTGKATIKACQIIADEQYKRNINISAGHHAEKLTKKEKVNLVWKHYIPAVGMGAVTVASIVSANRIGTGRAAAMAAAYTAIEKASNEYREKVVEKLGDHKERGIRDDIAQDRVNENPMSQRTVIVTGSGDVPCFEMYTARYFESTMENLKKAMNDVNFIINKDGYASLSDFYDKIGLPHTSISDDLGWNSDELLDLEFTTTLNDEQKPCIAFNYRVVPIRDYFRTRRYL